MSMTSRTSGTSRLERAAALRIFASWRQRCLRANSGCLPVVLYITRFHPADQGFSGVYTKFIGFSPANPKRRTRRFYPQAPLVGPDIEPDPSPWAVETDGAYPLVLVVAPVQRWRGVVRGRRAASAPRAPSRARRSGWISGTGARPAQRRLRPSLGIGKAALVFNPRQPGLDVVELRRG